MTTPDDPRSAPTAPTDARPTPPDAEARTWAMIAHLSALVGLLGNGIGFLLGPLIVWAVKKDQHPFVDEQGKEAMGTPYRRMISGAGHDAEYMASLAPTAMIFAPSRDGKSHSPEEWTDWDDVYLGAELLLNAVARLAEVDEAPCAG